MDVVIHFAALKAVGESVEKPLDYYVNNVTGTLNLLEVSYQHLYHTPFPCLLIFLVFSESLETSHLALSPIKCQLLTCYSTFSDIVFPGQVMSEAGVKCLVYSSSATVYGVPQYLPTDECHPTGVGITNPYGQTKYVCEQIMKDLSTADKVGH